MNDALAAIAELQTVASTIAPARAAELATLLKILACIISAIVIARYFADLVRWCATLANSIRLLWGRDVEYRNAVSSRRQYAQYTADNAERDQQRERARQPVADIQIEIGERRFRRLPIGKKAVLRIRDAIPTIQHLDSGILLLRGEPGAGKSTLLRSIVQTVGRSSTKEPFGRGRVAIHINLRTLRREANRPIDSALIREHVLRAANPMNNAVAGDFLRRWFDEGTLLGWWMFLFDAFDEIPELLASIADDNRSYEYACAIDDFARGMSRCVCVVASREFRGPVPSAWNTARLLGLSPNQKARLVNSHDLPSEIRDGLLAKAGFPQPDNAEALLSNPMFLTLACEAARAGKHVDYAADALLDSYVTGHFARHASYFENTLGLPQSSARRALAHIAYCVINESHGLELSSEWILTTLARDLNQTTEQAEICLIALRKTQLLRPVGDDSPTVQTLEFAHRRVQEFMAWEHLRLLRSGGASEERWTDPRWRDILALGLRTTGGVALRAKVVGLVSSVCAEALSLGTVAASSEATLRLLHGWRDPRSQHLLRLLASGVPARDGCDADAVRSLLHSFFARIWEHGTALDRKWIQQMFGAVPTQMLVWIATLEHPGRPPVEVALAALRGRTSSQRLRNAVLLLLRMKPVTLSGAERLVPYYLREIGGPRSSRLVAAWHWIVFAGWLDAFIVCIASILLWFGFADLNVSTVGRTTLAGLAGLILAMGNPRLSAGDEWRSNLAMTSILRLALTLLACFAWGPLAAIVGYLTLTPALIVFFASDSWFFVLGGAMLGPLRFARRVSSAIIQNLEAPPRLAAELDNYTKVWSWSRWAWRWFWTVGLILQLVRAVGWLCFGAQPTLTLLGTLSSAWFFVAMIAAVATWTINLYLIGYAGVLSLVERKKAAELCNLSTETGEFWSGMKLLKSEWSLTNVLQGAKWHSLAKPELPLSELWSLLHAIESRQHLNYRPLTPSDGWALVSRRRVSDSVQADELGSLHRCVVDLLDEVEAQSSVLRASRAPQSASVAITADDVAQM